LQVDCEVGIDVYIKSARGMNCVKLLLSHAYTCIVSPVASSERANHILACFTVNALYRLLIYLLCMQRSFSVVTELRVFVNVGDNPNSIAPKLQEVVVQIMRTEVCNRWHYYYKKIDKTMVCAGYKKGGRDSCKGDSGGPLACLRPDGSYTLFGLVSWGANPCARAKKPGVYAKTAAVLGWIKSYVKGAHLHFATITFVIHHCYHCFISLQVKFRRVEQ